MESRFIYPGSAFASHLQPPGAVYRTDDPRHPQDLLPYRELRANDAGQFLTGGTAAAAYEAQPLGRNGGAAPWWTTTDLGQRLPTGQRRLRRSEIISDEKLDERMNRYYDSDGLVVRDGAIDAVDDESAGAGLSPAAKKPQQWRRVCSPKMAVLTETSDGRLVWKAIPEEKEESRTSEVHESNRRPPQFKELAYVSRTPFGY